MEVLSSGKWKYSSKLQVPQNCSSVDVLSYIPSLFNFTVEWITTKTGVVNNLATDTLKALRIDLFTIKSL